jgi:hypothetical protein
MSLAAAVGGGAAVVPALGDDGGGLASAKPEDAIAQAKSALGKVPDFALSGTETDKGEPAATRLAGAITATGPADLVLEEGRSTAHMIVLPKAIYIKGNAAYWKAGLPKKDASLVPKLVGKWIKESAKQGADATSVLGDLSPKRIASCLDSHVGTLTNKGEKTVGGRKVVVIADAGDKPGTAPGELWLDERTALPVRVVQSGPYKAGGRKDAACDDSWPDKTLKSDVSLSKFGKAKKVVAPKGAVSAKQAIGGSGGSGGGGGSTPV